MTGVSPAITKPGRKELFDLLLSDYESYLEIQRTKGRRNVTEEDKNEIAALCQSRLERWEKGNAR